MWCFLFYCFMFFTFQKKTISRRSCLIFLRRYQKKKETGNDFKKPNNKNYFLDVSSLLGVNNRLRENQPRGSTWWSCRSWLIKVRQTFDLLWKYSLHAAFHDAQDILQQLWRSSYYYMLPFFKYTIFQTFFSLKGICFVYCFVLMVSLSFDENIFCVKDKPKLVAPHWLTFYITHLNTYLII